MRRPIKKGRELPRKVVFAGAQWALEKIGQMAEDARSARAFVVVEGDDKEAQRTLKGLTAAVGYIRHELGERLHLRRAPELFFELDRSRQYEARVDELLKRTKKARDTTGEQN